MRTAGKSAGSVMTAGVMAVIPAVVVMGELLARDVGKAVLSVR